jgi:hypothetical protein
MKNPIINSKKGDDENNNSLKSSAKVKVGIAITVAAASALAILTLVYADGTAQAFAAPPPPCPNCATQIEGSGFGTITVPEGSEIRPAPCDACFATISFDATTLPDTKKHEASGSLTITYIDPEAPGQEQVISAHEFIITGEIKSDSFRLEGIVPPSCAACDFVDFVLKGTIEKGTTDTANVVFKAKDGTTATFDNVKVTITTIPTET